MDRLERETLAAGLAQPVIILHPQVKQAFQIDQGDPAGGLLVGLLRSRCG